jgi:Bifunctional DNA primase/polymerase, N-terminal
MTTLEVAIEYIARGWAPIPIPHRSKGPIIEDWQNVQMTQDTAPRYFNGAPQNIGVVLGRASGGVTDLDLDSQEAIAAAPYLLPRTAVFGHASKRASHFIYKTNLFETHDRAAIKFMSADKLGLLEVRMGGGDRGAQTVFPPSTHVSGEPITWEDSGAKILQIDGAELLASASRLAAAAQLARSCPKVGGRHDAAFVLGGFLTRCKFPSPMIKLFVEAVAVASGQPRDKCGDMLRTAADGAECAKPAGFTLLAETFGKEEAKRVADWLGYKGREDAEAGNGDAHKRKAKATSTGHDGGDDGFIRGDGDQILKGHPENVRHAIGLLGVRLRYNEFSTQTEVSHLAKFGPDLTDAGAIRLRFLIQETYGFLPPLAL